MWCGFKKKYRKDMCHKEIRLCAQNTTLIICSIFTIEKKCWQRGKASVKGGSLLAWAIATFWWWALIPSPICTFNEYKNIRCSHMRSTNIRKVATSSI